MANKGVAIMRQLQGSDLKELNPSLKIYLAPLFGNNGVSKQKSATTDQRVLAKTFVPFLAQLLKACGAKLGSIHLTEDHATAGMADDLFSAMVIAIDGLSVLRSHLAGSSFEMELQRSALVRRLMVWKRFGSALSQSLLLYRSLCEVTASASAAESAGGQDASRKMPGRGTSACGQFSLNNCVLCPPAQADVPPELSALVVAAGIDLLWCTAESTEASQFCFQLAARLPEQLAAWISVLDPNSATKQRTALFRAMYKCTVTMLTDLKTFETDLVEKICVATLSLCASSTQADQYAKVARKFCSTMSCQGSGWGFRAVAVCSAAFGELRSHNALHGTWSSGDVFDLVDWFSRACQTSGCFSDGWLHISNLVDNIQKVSPGDPTVLIGLYGIALILMQADSSQASPGNPLKESRRDTHTLPDRSKLEVLSEDAEFFSRACSLLHNSEEILRFLLRLEQAPSETNLAEKKSLLLGGSLDGSNGREPFTVNGRTFVNAAWALHYLQKPLTAFVHHIWKVQIARSSEQDFRHGSFVSALGNLSKLFYPMMEKGTRCNDLNDHEKEVFRNGFPMALQASISALRISTLLLDDRQENFQLMNNMIHNLQPEEQGTLMSSTYNMGVQLFNTKQYDLACSPFALANKAGWAKASSSCSTASVNDVVSEACAKCVALAESQNRSGDPRASKMTLTDGLIQWAKVRTESLPVKMLHSLLKSYIKMVCVEHRALSDGKLEGEGCSLSSMFCDLQATLPAKLSGLILEEVRCATV